MKNIITTLLTTFGVSGLLLSAAAQTTATAPDDNNNNPPATTDQAAPPAGTDTGTAAAPPDAAMTDQAAPGDAANAADATAAPADAAPAERGPVESTVILPRGNAPQSLASGFTPPAQAIGSNPNDLNLNFVRAPLDEVLNYLSDAAAFIIVRETPVSGTISVKGNHLTQEEVVDLLNAELNRNNYAAIQNERTLTIMDKNEAKTGNIPVRTGSDPNAIKKDDVIVTQIIPIRFVEARQLVSDLSSFVSAQATVVANEAGNSIIVTDTQANIRHLMEIIKSVDDSAEAETEVNVYPLKHASPSDVATELANIFRSSGSGGAQSPISCRRRPWWPRRRRPWRRWRWRAGRIFRGHDGWRCRQRQRNHRPHPTADGGDGGPNLRIQAVVVTAPKTMTEEIKNLIEQLDVTSDRDQDVYVFKTKNGDPQQMVQVLQGLFPSSSSSRGNNSSSSSSPIQTRAQNTATSMGSTTTTSGSAPPGAVDAPGAFNP